MSGELRDIIDTAAYLKYKYGRDLQKGPITPSDLTDICELIHRLAARLLIAENRTRLR